MHNKAKGEIVRGGKQQVFGYAGHGIVVVNWKQFHLLISVVNMSLAHSQLIVFLFKK